VLDAPPPCRLDRANGLCGQHSSAATPSGSRRGPRWHVVATYAQAERRAVANLNRQGYETYLPLTLVTRRDRVLRTLLHRVEVPLFPAYAFCRFDPGTTEWYPIRNTFGVYQLLTNSAGQPTPVADAEIRALQAAVADRATCQAETPQWAPGAPVALLAGALRGHPAVVLEVRGDHATLAVLLFGALRQVVAPVAWLVARQ
jgi:transcription antitermination factor NusG